MFVVSLYKLKDNRGVDKDSIKVVLHDQSTKKIIFSNLKELKGLCTSKRLYINDDLTKEEAMKRKELRKQRDQANEKLTKIDESKYNLKYDIDPNTSKKFWFRADYVKGRVVKCFAL